MAHYEPHQDLHCLQIQLFLSLVVKELRKQVGEHTQKILCITSLIQITMKMEIFHSMLQTFEISLHA